MPAHRSIEAVQAARRMLDEGATAREVGSRLGISIGTISNWRRGRLPRRAIAADAGVTFCPACGAEAHDFASLPQPEYSYLLASYLGDGCVYRNERTYLLRITQDLEYPGIVEETAAEIQAVRGRWPHVAEESRGERCLHLTSYWNQWPCLLPQHGPGRKHKRKIELVEWQWEVVRAEPGQFLRGLIHTDGWRGMNRVFVKGKHYEYPRYQFSSRSEDIRKLFTDVCEILEIAWRPWGRWHVSVARREAVAKLDEHVGLKY